MIETDAQLAELIPQLEAVDRIAVDTEADSLHCYYEKLCLVQLSFAGRDYLVDPLANLDLKPLARALAPKEIVLQGADFDLRLLRRSLDFVATRIFDTVIAARLLGIRAFSLAALPAMEATEVLLHALRGTKSNAELLLSGLRD